MISPPPRKAAAGTDNVANELWISIVRASGRHAVTLRALFQPYADAVASGDFPSWYDELLSVADAVAPFMDTNTTNLCTEQYV